MIVLNRHMAVACFIVGSLQCTVSNELPIEPGVVTVSGLPKKALTDPSIADRSTVAWSPDSRKLVAAFRLLKTPPVIVDGKTGIARSLDTRLIDKYLKGYLGQTYPQAAWLSDKDLLLQLSLANVSSDNYPSFFFRIQADGRKCLHLLATAGLTEAAVVPERRQLLFYSGYDSARFVLGELKPAPSFGILPSLKNTDQTWPRIFASKHVRNRRIVLGNFLTDFNGRILKPLSEQEMGSPFARVGIPAAERFLQTVGRPVGTASYLPLARRVGFAIGKKTKQEESADWAEDAPTFGIATLSLTSYTVFRTRIPANLQFFGGTWPEPGIRWAPDGKSLFLRHKDQNELWQMDVKTGRAKVLTTSLPGYPLQVWPSPNGSKIAVLYGGRTTSTRERPRGICIVTVTM